MTAIDDAVPPGIRLGIVRSISYGLFGKPDASVPQLRKLGATLVRVYFSAKTASVHVSNVLAKLGVANRAETAVAAHRLGLTRR